MGRAPSPYSLQTGYYAPNLLESAVESFGYSSGWGAAILPSGYGGGFALSSQAGNPNLKPEIKTEWDGYFGRCPVLRPYAEFQLRTYLQSSDLDPTFHSSYKEPFLFGQVPTKALCSKCQVPIKT